MASVTLQGLSKNFGDVAAVVSLQSRQSQTASS